ncbi:hypothetical protein [Luteipulveratus halotolerans]|uniref:Uncharacterized protein n=1 Tax=Luteipulveratus halotolerans TaxID=1631356 RepID=A0A0L6CN36_9MICO|nr:hypothetical protein [Luteipulveratus halotolerans]KNX39065.1 hypothetical protein VV01_21145 [Luteipulveratus halotolerans]
MNDVELERLASTLFGRELSPERIRPWAEQLVAPHLGDLRAAVRGSIPMFRASVLTSPDGQARAHRMPRDSEGRRELHGFDELRTIMDDVITQACAEPWEQTGRPTGLVVDKTPGGLTAYLTFDNFLDATAISPDGAGDDQAAPLAWREATTLAAQRDPRFQPSWLVAAVGLLNDAGAAITINAQPLVDDDVVTTGERDIRERGRLRPVRREPEAIRPRRAPDPYIPPPQPEPRRGLLGRLFGR